MIATRSSRARKLALPYVALVSALLVPLPALAHGFMFDPASRSVGMPNEDYQYCFGTPGCECGNYPDAGPIVATYEAGQTIHISIEITQSHDPDAIFRFQLCSPDQQSPDCFVQGEFASVDFDRTTGTHEYDVDLPDGVVCDPCVLRWKWDYGFLSCADVRVVSKVESRIVPWGVLKARFR